MGTQISYDQCEDGLYLATSRDVYGINNPAGCIFVAERGQWRERTFGVWPLTFERRRRAMTLTEAHWSVEQMVPLTRQLVLDYLSQRAVAPSTYEAPVGDLMVPVRTNETSSHRGRLPLQNGTLWLVTERDARAVPLQETYHTGTVGDARGWAYTTWERIEASEAADLAAYARRWWGVGGRKPGRAQDAPVGQVPEGARAETSAYDSLLTVTLTERVPNESAAVVLDETTVDGEVVRQVRVPMMDAETVFLYAEEGFVVETAKRIADSNSERTRLDMLLDGHVLSNGKSWADLRRVEHEGKQWIEVSSLDGLKAVARRDFDWCATADRVLADVRAGRKATTFVATFAGMPQDTGLDGFTVRREPSLRISFRAFTSGDATRIANEYLSALEGGPIHWRIDRVRTDD